MLVSRWLAVSGARGGQGAPVRQPSAIRAPSSQEAEFVTPPIDRRAEIRCYMRKLDGKLCEFLLCERYRARRHSLVF